MSETDWYAQYREAMQSAEGLQETVRVQRKRIEELERRWNDLPWEEMENHIEWWEEHRDAFRPTRSLEILCKILAAREEA